MPCFFIYSLSALKNLNNVVGIIKINYRANAASDATSEEQYICGNLKNRHESKTITALF